jgi:hypothetical protein
LGAMPLKTNAGLDSITDPEISITIEKIERGGLRFMCPSRSAKANHSHMGERYDSNRKYSYVTYYDTGNLYGAPMSDSFPFKELKFERDLPLGVISTDPWRC